LRAMGGLFYLKIRFFISLDFEWLVPLLTAKLRFALIEKLRFSLITRPKGLALNIFELLFNQQP
jgi:hypothetical protein